MKSSPHRTDQLVSVSRPTGGVAIVEMGEEGSLNLWNEQLEARLFSVLDDVAHDPDVRAIGVLSRGRAFSGGTDLQAMSDLLHSAGSVSDDVDTVLRRMVARAVQIPKPVVAAVGGPCIGIGLSFALSCDIRIAADDAVFRTAYAQRGLAAEHGASWLLPRIVGLGNALDMLMTSRPVDAFEAKAIGLVTRVVDLAELRKGLEDLTTGIARSASPRSLAVIKRQVYEDSESSWDSAYYDAAYETVQARRSQDAREGVASFLNGDNPIFPAPSAKRDGVEP